LPSRALGNTDVPKLFRERPHYGEYLHFGDPKQ